MDKAKTRSALFKKACLDQQPDVLALAMMDLFLRFVAPMNFQDLSWSDWVHQVPSPDVGPWQPLAANRKCANALGRVIHSTLSFKMCSLFMGLVQNTRRLCKGGRLTLFMASRLHLHLLVLQFAGSNGRMCMLLVLNAWLVMV